MAIDTKLISQLRAMTGAGILAAKNALDETDGDMEKAAEILRKKGMAKAAKKASRETKEGLVHSYIHGNGKIGVLVEVLCETDFVARNEVFVELCHDIALHISAADPLYLKREDVPAETLEKERDMFRQEAAGKPEDIIEKIVEGKIAKYLKEVVLLDQPFVKDEDKTITELVQERIAHLGENIQVTRFSRFNIS